MVFPDFSHKNPQEKQDFINHVFDSVAGQYDVMNDLMSAGMHRLWKNDMVGRLTLPRSRCARVLDLAGGTGDIAFRIIEFFGGDVYVTVADINEAMLAIGSARATKKGLSSQVEFMTANAEELPFEDASFDCCTISFGIRNVPNVLKALREVRRVLKIGGRFFCLEFAEVSLPAWKYFYDLWSFRMIPEIAEWIVHDKDPYIYLVESIRNFPNQKTFCAILSEAGFEKIRFDNYAGGIAALYSAWKL